MKIEMMPTINLGDLTDAVNMQYGLELTRRKLGDMLFPDSYCNDCYKVYYFDGFYAGEEYEQENCVIAYLMDVLPEHTKVLIDVSW